MAKKSLAQLRAIHAKAEQEIREEHKLAEARLENGTLTRNVQRESRQKARKAVKRKNGKKNGQKKRSHVWSDFYGNESTGGQKRGGIGPEW